MCLALAPVLAGCWDRREVETLALATALSLDAAPAPAFRPALLVNAQFAIAARFAGAAGPGAGGAAGMGPGSGARAPFARTSGGPTGPTVWVVGAAGQTLTQAMERISALAPRLPLWAHVRLLVVGEELARQGLDRVLDGLMRDRQIRRTPWIVVARGVPGYRILELPNPLSPAPEEGISRLLQNLRSQSASTLPQRLQDFLVAYAQPGVDPFTAGITYELPVPHDPVLAPSAEPLPALPRPQGTAVFRGDRLVGWLTAEESQGLALLVGESRSFLLTLPCPAASGYLTVRVLRFDSRRTVVEPASVPEAASRGVAFRVEVRAEGSLNEQECRPALDGARLRQLEDEVSRALE
ncbi:MAG TPA: Ger(x)C family spore germination C-terminal domain-containing protein, partial [Limnochordales bacterium]